MGPRVGLVAVKSEEPAHLPRLSGRPPVAYKAVLSYPAQSSKITLVRGKTWMRAALETPHVLVTPRLCKRWLTNDRFYCVVTRPESLTMNDFIMSQQNDHKFISKYVKVSLQKKGLTKS